MDNKTRYTAGHCYLDDNDNLQPASQITHSAVVWTGASKHLQLRSEPSRTGLLLAKYVTHVPSVPPYITEEPVCMQCSKYNFTNMFTVSIIVLHSELLTFILLQCGQERPTPVISVWLNIFNWIFAHEQHYSNVARLQTDRCQVYLVIKWQSPTGYICVEAAWD